ncbi:MAG: hypothetical protein K1Y36_28250 [Blastocatellia bacterium]|nr:hypothetical protein [Blastocatellia bacterium]
MRNTTVIANRGTDGTGVQYTDTIAGDTTLVSSSVRISPIAFNVGYTCFGNLGIMVPTGSDVVANDFTGTPVVTLIAAFDAASAPYTDPFAR